MHIHSHTCSKCSMKGGNLRELTRWLELPGNPPIGTFLPVYDLLRTHTGRKAQNWSQIFKFIPHSGCKLEQRKDKNLRLLYLLFLFNIWTQFGCDNDAIWCTCRPLNNTRETTHAASHADYYSVSSWTPRCCRAVLAPLPHFNFSFSFPNFCGRFGIGPPGPFSKHIEDFYVTILCQYHFSTFFLAVIRM